MKKTIVGVPGITGAPPELPPPSILPIKNGRKRSQIAAKKGYQTKNISRSRRNLPGGK